MATINAVLPYLVPWPADRAALRRLAKAAGAPKEILNFLDTIPEGPYENLEDLKWGLEMASHPPSMLIDRFFDILERLHLGRQQRSFDLIISAIKEKRRLETYLANVNMTVQLDVDKSMETGAITFIVKYSTQDSYSDGPNERILEVTVEKKPLGLVITPVGDVEFPWGHAVAILERNLLRTDYLPFP